MAPFYLASTTAAENGNAFKFKYPDSIYCVLDLTQSGLAAKWESNYLLLEINTTVAWPLLQSTSSLHPTATTNLQEYDPVRSTMMETRSVFLPIAVRLCGLVTNHRCNS